MVEEQDQLIQNVEANAAEVQRDVEQALSLLFPHLPHFFLLD
jgi:hypothetical protein